MQLECESEAWMRKGGGKSRERNKRIAGLNEKQCSNAASQNRSLEHEPVALEPNDGPGTNGREVDMVWRSSPAGVPISQSRMFLSLAMLARVLGTDFYRSAVLD